MCIQETWAGFLNKTPGMENIPLFPWDAHRKGSFVGSLATLPGKGDSQLPTSHPCGAGQAEKSRFSLGDVPSSVSRGWRLRSLALWKKQGFLWSPELNISLFAWLWLRSLSLVLGVNIVRFLGSSQRKGGMEALFWMFPGLCQLCQEAAT